MTSPELDPIAAVFDADPRTLSDDAINTLIADLRRRRLAFASEEAAKAAAPKAKRLKAAPPSTNTSLGLTTADINSLDDL